MTIYEGRVYEPARWGAPPGRGRPVINRDDVRYRKEGRQSGLRGAFTKL